MANEGAYHHPCVGACAPKYFAVLNKFDSIMVVCDNHNAFRVLGESNDLILL
jgi:hypothetical protein